MPETISHTTEIPLSMSGMRIDKVLSELFSDYSRSQLSRWLKSGAITVNNQRFVPKMKVCGGETIVIETIEQAKESWHAQDIDIDVCFEDEHCLIVNKPQGLVVHPGAGNPDSTLVNALLHYSPSLSHLPRAGIIHRLDKDTTGLLIVAKSLKAYTHLVDMMQQRLIKRQYQAIINGKLLIPGSIDAPIARNPKNRLKMAVVASGKQAMTHYDIIQQYSNHCLLDVALETGRTHQIRVHFTHIKHPIVGDPLYGSKQLTSSKDISAELKQALNQFNRQALHAYHLGFLHPITQEKVSVKSPLPTDMQTLIHLLEQG